MADRCLNNPENLNSIIGKTKEAESLLVNSYEELTSLLSTIQADSEWQNMGKVESEAFLELITMVHKDVSGESAEDCTGTFPSMIQELNKHMTAMENFYKDSTAYNNLVNKVY